MTVKERKGKENGLITRLADWLDSRFGLSYQVLRPAPRYAVSPFYWLGALTVVAFLIQGVTGMIMMLYYVPSPPQAYPSTILILQKIELGRFLETVHLYTAYAMIMLAFMHLMRGYFVSVYKKPREAMWVVGMLMGFVTLGFGLTGYLLPWTVVSKSATDVTVGMIDNLPPSLAAWVRFLVAGAGGDATQLLRFYDLHVVVLPAVLLVLLTVKMYMLEVHGISQPASGDYVVEKERKLVPIFPDLTLYLAELAALFGAAMLLISVLFPLALPPEYSPQLAAQYTPQPDWYFLWIYQIVKISVFEGPGLPVALSLVTVLFALLFLLPFIDRTKERRIVARPKLVTAGMIFIGELLVLAYWGFVTPGQVIPIEQAVLVVGGTALGVALVAVGMFRWVRRSRQGILQKQPARARSGHLSAAAFVGVLALGALSVGNLSNAAIELLSSLSLSTIESTLLSSVGLVVAILSSMRLISRMQFARRTGE
jgi:quinol-cytochrome oxidoreductase complex cytochrome b subunit